MVNPVAEEFKETLVRANEMFHEKSVEEGTHEQLMDRKGLYHKLYHLQCESLEWKVNYIES